MATAIAAKTYVGHRYADGTAVIEVRDAGQEIGRPLRHLVQHSPTGFEWGYGGSGPSDTARSILVEHLGHDVPPVIYQRFKFKLVAGWPAQWSVTSDQIAAVLDDILKEASITCPRCGDRGMTWATVAGVGQDAYCSCAIGQAAMKEDDGQVF